ncbi:hypothetical protein [Rhodococcus rhodochrous]|uniref:hypothetical protein n=1 Tax=Rhodococcus rhodochrous TaxID=1829 RepID=UPI00177B857D|nr:hypothetical protein [Rhodococcus rhodochrous]
MSTALSTTELQRYIERVSDRLPKKIIVDGKTLTLEIKYFGSLDNFWTLSYGTNDTKDTFIHRDEASLEACVLGAWRSLALRKDEWEFES